MEKKSNWQKDLEKLLVELGWGGVKGAQLESLSMTEIGMMLRDRAWREVKWKREVEAKERSKLGVMQRLLVHGSKDRCMDVKCKRLRRMLAKRKYCFTEN